MVDVRRSTRRPRWWGELVLIAWLCWLYDDVTNLAPLRYRAAVAHALQVVHLEAVTHLDPERAMDHWLAGHHTLGWWVGTYYDNAHFVVTLGVLGWLYWRHAEVYRPLRTSLAMLNVVALAVFWLWPMAPPRLLPGGSYIDVVGLTGSPGSWHAGALGAHADQLAAMPSLHLAWAAWSAWAAWRVWKGRRWAAAVWAYPALTTVAVLATGNHYVADVVAGLALTAAVVPATDLAYRLARERVAPLIPVGARREDAEVAA